MKKQYVKPVVAVVKMTESHAIMAGSVKLNGFIQNGPTTGLEDDRVNISWGGTQINDHTEEDENGFLWAD